MENLVFCSYNLVVLFHCVVTFITRLFTAAVETDWHVAISQACAESLVVYIMLL